MNPKPKDTTALRFRFVEAGQGHLLRYWEGLKPEDQDSLIRDMEDAWPKLAPLRRILENPPPAKEKGAWNPPQVVDSRSVDPGTLDRAEEHLRGGKMACLLVAGGQASRLGWDGPKGTLPITPVRGKSLYQVHAEKILALRRHYDAPIPLYVMTSPATDGTSRKFFQEHGNFGLPAEDVFFFTQGLVPTFGKDRLLLLRTKQSLFLNPDGHGGLVEAAAQAGVFADAARRGVETFFYFQVDNPLVRIGERAFLGQHLESQSDYSLKVVAKRDPAEKVGVLVQESRRMSMIEYSDLTEEMRQARDGSGQLLFGWGSIAIHLFRREWLETMAGREEVLPWHQAQRQVQAINSRGRKEEMEAIKFEKFIFDLLPHAGRTLAMAADRDQEFAPVKNKSGQDTPESVRETLGRRARAWVEKAGLTLQGPVEISPLFARDEAEFVAKVQQGAALPADGVFEG